MVALGSTPGSAAGVKVNEAVADPGECHDDARSLSAKGAVTYLFKDAAGSQEGSRTLQWQQAKKRMCSSSALVIARSDG
ncbi:MAG: hypothetical protein RLZZ117_1867 [Cyanobacteriota bacterium]|jgi:hypothetical protein